MTPDDLRKEAMRVSDLLASISTEVVYTPLLRCADAWERDREERDRLRDYIDRMNVDRDALRLRVEELEALVREAQCFGVIANRSVDAVWHKAAARLLGEKDGRPNSALEAKE